MDSGTPRLVLGCINACPHSLAVSPEDSNRQVNLSLFARRSEADSARLLSLPPSKLPVPISDHRKRQQMATGGPQC